MHDTKTKDFKPIAMVRFSRNLRKTLYRKASYTCQCCGTKRTAKNNLVLTLHHIVPSSYGGLGTAENALVCCIDCHINIHHYINKLQNLLYTFWEDLKIYILDLPNAPKKCKKRFLTQRAPQAHIDYIPKQQLANAA
tara:strand:+ start:1117 stop:1527 length:411 start_codon:yes stop_codon:yes gene_type:complete